MNQQYRLRVRPSLFGMKALFPEAGTRGPVGKDFGVPDCQERGVLSALATGAQPVDAARVTRAAKAPSVHWRTTVPNPWVCLEEVGEGGAAQREVTWRVREEKTWGRWVLSGDAKRECRVGTWECAWSSAGKWRVRLASGDRSRKGAGQEVETGVGVLGALSRSQLPLGSSVP